MSRLILFVTIATAVYSHNLHCGFSVIFTDDGGSLIRDRKYECKHAETPDISLHDEDMFVVFTTAKYARSCNISVFHSAPNSLAQYSLLNDTNFAKFVLYGLVLKAKDVHNISFDCPEQTSNVKKLESSGSNQCSQCCDDASESVGCFQCAKGMYMIGSNCYDCHQGKTTQSIGNFTKEYCACQPGYETSPEGYCRLCKTGKYKSEWGHHNCSSCDHYAEVETLGAQRCASQKNTTNKHRQNAVMYLQKKRQCGPECCVAGEYWNAHETKCMDCQDGVNYSDTRGSLTCKECKRPAKGGQERVGCFDSEGTIRSCKEGYYRARDSTSITCDKCPENQTTFLPGERSETNCLCKKGFYKQEQGKCLQCPIGKFKLNVGDEESCDPCPNLTTTLRPGSKSKSQCLCKAGYVGSAGGEDCRMCARPQYNVVVGAKQCENCTKCRTNNQYPKQCGFNTKGICRKCEDSRCPANQTCDYCNFCHYDIQYYQYLKQQNSSLVANQSSYFNSTVDQCGVCDGIFTAANNFSTCFECEAGKYGIRGPRVCAHGETDTSPDTSIKNAIECRICQVCKPGKFSQKGDEQCSSCQKGKFSNISGASFCHNCTAGSFSDVQGASMCTNCSAGTFSDRHSAVECDDCGTGKYIEVSGATACKNCSAGTYSDIQGTVTCEDCGTGKYIAVSGATACKNCSKGTYSDIQGMVTCEDCAMGKYIAVSGATACKNCSAGTYSDIEGTVTCNDCGMGKHIEVSGATACKNCSAGTYSDITGADHCKNCGNGNYSEQEGSWECQICPDDDKYVVSAAKDKCLCQKGSYLSGEANTTHLHVCESCQPGKFTSTANKSPACTNCADKFYVQHYGATGCTFCEGINDDTEEGMDTGFGVGENNDVCLCKAGFHMYNVTTPARQLKCVYCTPGFYTDALNNKDACDSCPEGKYASGNYYSYCLLCYVGQYQNSTGKSFCEDCEPGKVSHTGSATCNDCEAGKYSDKRAHTCTDCEKGKYQLNTAQSSCDNCAAGKYASSEGKATCYNCPSGKVQPNTGQSFCTDCTDNTIASFSNIECWSCYFGKTANADHTKCV